MRRTIVFFALLAASACALGILALLPSYFFVRREEYSLRESLRLEETFVVRSGLGDTFAAVRQNTAMLDRVKKFTFASGRIPPLAEKIIFGNKGILIIQLTAKKDGSVTMIGVADTRDDLLGFESTLRDFNKFDSIMIPLSDIIQDRNIHFSIQAMLKPDSRL